MAKHYGKSPGTPYGKQDKGKWGNVHSPATHKLKGGSSSKPSPGFMKTSRTESAARGLKNKSSNTGGVKKPGASSKGGMKSGY